MKKILCFLLAILSVCFIFQLNTVLDSCELLNTATVETDELPPAWYIEAGEILKMCGVPDAQKRAETYACYAERKHSSNLVCD